MRQDGELRLWIAVRSDLKMPTGKLAAQVAHAATRAIWSQREKAIAAEYMSGAQTKIVVADDDINATMKAAQDAKIPAFLVVDAGRTVFGGPTKTCVAIGPTTADKLPGRIRSLPLMRDEE